MGVFHNLNSLSESKPIQICFAKFDFLPRHDYEIPFFKNELKNLEIDILGATKVDSDWLIGRASSRIGIVPITYLKDTNTTQILFCGEDFYENIVELKQKEQIWILQEKNSQLQAQLCQMEDEKQDLQSSLNQYQCCVICLIEIEQRAALSCGHSFCNDCCNRFWSERKCPVCQEKFDVLVESHI